MIIHDITRLIVLLADRNRQSFSEEMTAGFVQERTGNGGRQRLSATTLENS